MRGCKSPFELLVAMFVASQMELYLNAVSPKRVQHSRGLDGLLTQLLRIELLVSLLAVFCEILISNR